MNPETFYAPDQLTSCYGDERPGGVVHRGVDYEAEYGSEIPAIHAGVVIGVGYDDTYGNYVLISSDPGVWLYGHLDNTPVSPEIGTRISRGETVGRVGETGDTTGPHLHLALIRGRRFVDPLAPALPVLGAFNVEEMIVAGAGLFLMLLGFRMLAGSDDPWK